MSAATEGLPGWQYSCLLPGWRTARLSLLRLPACWARADACTVRPHLGGLLQALPQQDVGLGLVGKQQAQLGGVALVLHDAPHDLRGQQSAASRQGEAAALVAQPEHMHSVLPNDTEPTWYSGVMPVPPPSRLMRRQRPSRPWCLRGSRAEGVAATSGPQEVEQAAHGLRGAAHAPADFPRCPHQLGSLQASGPPAHGEVALMTRQSAHVKRPLPRYVNSPKGPRTRMVSPTAQGRMSPLSTPAQGQDSTGWRSRGHKAAQGVASAA